MSGAGAPAAAVRRTLEAAGNRGAAGLDAARARPRHGALALVIVALAAGPHLPGSALLAAAGIAAVLGAVIASGARATGALLAAALTLAAGSTGAARAAALERSALGPRIGHALRDHVVVRSAPRTDAYGGWSAEVELHGEPVLLLGRGRRPAVGIGDGLHVRGILEAPGVWATRLRVHAELRASSATPSGRRRGGPAGALDGVRRRAQRALDQGLPPAQAGLLRGMVLGDDSALPSGVRDDFRASGLSHLVAASGTNVMLLATLAVGVAVAAGLERVGRLVLALGLIALYVPLAGGGPSIQRAGIMGAAVLVAALAGRPASRWYALGLAACGTLLLDPRAVTALGWQLSFAAVVGILLLAPGWREGLRRRGAPTLLADAVAVTGAAGLSTAPVLAATLGEVSPVSLLANVLAAPAVAPVMWLGFLAAALGQLSPAPAALLDAVAGLPLGYLTWLASEAAGVPWAVVPAGAVTVTAACAVVVGVLSSRRVRRVAAPVGVAAVAGAVLLAPAQAAPAGPPTGLRVTVLDVGQGDAVLVQEPGRAVLVDAGPPDGDVVGRLREAGVGRLDALVITHASSDHEGGAAAVLRELGVGLLVDGRRVSGREPDEAAGSTVGPGDAVTAAAGRAGVRRLEPAAGQTVRAGGLALRVRWPPPVAPGAAPPLVDDHNERATVLEVEAWGARVLLPADAESDVLGQLDLAPVDVLKVSHHGSADGGLPAVVARIRPQVAVIPVGRDNGYGHPAPSTLRALRDVPAVLRTDRDGTVRLDHAGDRWLVRTARAGTGDGDG